VGFSVQWIHVEKLPRLNKIGRTVRHYTIADSIEGWANALTELMYSFISGQHIEFDYSEIRPEGAYLKTSGGIAPGHLPLKEALENIRQILLGAQGRQLRPIECHDIICHSAEAVLAGGIRRSSLISLFSYEDTEMLYAKSQGAFNPVTGLNAQRAMANNSAVINRKSSKEIFYRIIRIAEEGWGDPGFFFTDNLDYGCNPCGEIGILPTYGDKTGFGFCNLCEVNMAAITSEGELWEAVKAATIIGTLQAGYTDFPYLGYVTEQLVRRDSLLGISLTGMMDNPELSFDPKVQKKCAELVKEMNLILAPEIGVNLAKRCTTIKPGGTAPLELGGVASGIHPHHARRYFRRVTANPLEPAFLHFRKINPHMIEEKPNGDFCIVFPVQVSSNAKTVKEMSALDFMKTIFSTYDNWIVPGTREGTLTHNVSATVTISPDEKDAVIQKVWENRSRIAAMSFATRMLDKKFPFAPREEVTPADESRWNYLIENYRPVDWTKIEEPGIEILNADCECGSQKGCSIG
jgi:ribonucleoside-diphosphate reductase alpha chain